ncbi:MAG: Asp-tRNA(Asn)/Glu-tRNA(Gln) amidotransferase GatCAB subunit A [Bryobacterales bacterium]|nr:Asp-tRNA(Asn)/Glu-tRNA(Gln) amidotransferase GatCAB subunit A [Bryobacterales bacterium]
MTIAQAGRALRERRISSVELTRYLLDQIGRLNPEINAFLTVTGDLALDQARRADAGLRAGADCGPLHGIPIALKDVFCTRGIRTTAGAVQLSENVPDYDAAVTERLSAAGSVMLGKTGMHEFAYGITSNNPHYGAVRNPWNPACIPGGSSGGSGAAVASGLAFAALGTDTGGSIRVPASFCGTVGVKPTFGLVSRFGTLPLGFTLDHVGPLARTVRDAALVLDAISGYDPRDPATRRRRKEALCPPPSVSLSELCIGLPANYFFDRARKAVKEAVVRAASLAESLGARVTTVTVPDMEGLTAVHRLILLPEASAVIGKFHQRRGELGADVRALYEQGRLVSAVDYIDAQRLRTEFRRQFARLFESIDVLLTPATLFSAPRIGQDTVDVDGVPEDVRLMTTASVRAINVLGYPALSMPCGLDPGGMPLGLQAIARPFDERLLLRVAAALEDAGISAIGRAPLCAPTPFSAQN